jgi:hypothetical protein
MPKPEPFGKRKKKQSPKGPVYQLKITLDNVEPAIWRRVEVKDCTLSKLHQIIQNAMGWEFSHLWMFEAGGQRYGEDADDEMDAQPARSVRLGQLVEQGVKEFGYTYDFGDNWEHTIEVEKVLEAGPNVAYPRCVAGARACPPEDCGGAWGYGDFLAALRDPKHESHEDMMEWSGGEFNPEAFDLAAINARLEEG